MVTNTYRHLKKRRKYVKINIIWLFDLVIDQELDTYIHIPMF